MALIQLGILQDENDDITKESSHEKDTHRAMEQLWNQCLSGVIQSDVTDDDIIRLANYWANHSELPHSTRNPALHLQDNGLTCASAAAVGFLVQKGNVMALNLSENIIKGPGLSSLIQRTQSLQILNLSQNKLEAGSASTLCSMLRSHPHLHTLRLARNNLKQKCIKLIATTLCNQETALRHLDLSQNKLEDRGAKAIALAIDPRNNPFVALETLDLSHNKIRQDGAERLADAFVKGLNRTIRHLDMSYNFIDTVGLDGFGVAVNRSPTLKRLDLSRNNGGDLGAEYFCYALYENPESSLVWLDLSWNSIQDAGAIEIANMLRDNRALLYLSLKSNAIGDEGVAHIGDALLHNMTLKELDLTGNQIRDPAALIDALCQPSSTLQQLHYEHNHFSPEGVAEVEAAFQFRTNRDAWLDKMIASISKKRQANLTLTNHSHGDQEIIQLVNSVVKHGTKITNARFGSPVVTYKSIAHISKSILSQSGVVLHRLYISKSPAVGDRGAATLAQGLLHNKTLTVLSLTECSLTQDGAKYLANALRRNRTLNRLSLEGNAISDTGFRELCHHVVLGKEESTPSALTSLNVSQCGITDAGVFNMPPTAQLKELHLSRNDISDAGVLHLAHAVMDSDAMTHLYINNNPKLTDRGRKTLDLYMRDTRALSATS